ncbi:hypothetical protein [Bowdeniella massiliensis]|uniref:hypothetical protein n=1 Tax=Bowdeniella massiliensis TaxID=2932264 RepID=UPI002028AE08|nr:hypothetical protein [Bowdeniella massiliensis]
MVERFGWLRGIAIPTSVALAVLALLIAMARPVLGFVAESIDAATLGEQLRAPGAPSGAAIAAFAAAVAIFALAPLGAFALWFVRRRTGWGAAARFVPVAIVVLVLVPVVISTVRAVQDWWVQGGELVRIPTYFTRWFTSQASVAMDVAAAQVMGPAIAGAILAGWVVLAATILIGAFVQPGREREDWVFSYPVALGSVALALLVGVVGGWVLLV